MGFGQSPDVRPRLTLQAIVAQDSSRIALADKGLTLVVGANNAGKSRLLRDVLAYVTHTPADTATVSALEIARTPEQLTHEDLDLSGLARQIRAQDAMFNAWSPMGLDHFQFHESTVISAWTTGTGLESSTRCFVDLVTPIAALATTKDHPRGGPMPEHRVLLDQMRVQGDVDNALSDLCQQVFGFPLTFDRLTSRDQYRVGRPAASPPVIDRPTQDYAQELAALPLLEDQGDGVRTFIGGALHVLANPARILLMDEPDAFLHPPQARRLGRWLAKRAIEGDQQLVVATHNRDLLVGALEAEVDIHLIRVSRTREGKTHLSELNAERIREIWADPALRYSNILQGVFHGQTVVAESDADCRFYRAVLDQLAEERQLTTQATETLFVPSSGKDHAAPMLKALSALGVRCRTILDFDILRETAKAKAVVASLGGTWHDAIDNDYKALRDQANAAKNWDALKKNGIGPLKGTVRQAAERLLGALAEQGLLIVPTGEMEDLDPSVPETKGDWVREMLSSGRFRTCTPARELVSALLT